VAKEALDLKRPANSRRRLRYCRPILQSFGKVVQLTRGGTGSGSDSIDPGGAGSVFG